MWQNFTATEVRFQPNAPTAWLQTPDSRHKQTPPDPTINATTALSAFPATRVASVRNYVKFFSHRTNGALVESSVTDIGYYV
jgi:hypothetical protein